MIIDSVEDIDIFINGINLWYDPRKKVKHEI